MKTAGVALVMLLGAAAPALAQADLPLGTRVGSAVPAAPEAAGYDDGGRRDPFISLLASKKPAAGATPARPRPGLAGVALADVAVKGVVHNGASTVALLEGPGGKSFVARTKDRLQDAVVKVIDADGVTFVQQVVDALGVSRPRDVRKSLRQTLVEEDR